jgi:hypothetical protein
MYIYFPCTGGEEDLFANPLNKDSGELTPLK